MATLQSSMALTVERLRTTILLLVVLFAMACVRPTIAYSLLTHEQLIDLAWKDSIVPLLLSQYPNLTPSEITEARAYAYGGCVIQDIGYYPFGDTAFSDLTHYVRSGDFVVNLFRNAHNANELAFAVGALSHYIGDSVGHSIATNRAVPVEFPKLRAKYGSVVSYALGKRQHQQTEFAFDINEIAHHRLAPLQFVRRAGLQVPVKQVALAYYQTYGLTEDFTAGYRKRFNVHGYRSATRTLIPRVAYAVTLLHRRHLPPEPVTPEFAEMVKEAAAVDKENNWEAYRRKPGFKTYALAGLLFVLPKLGPLKMVAVKGPTTDTEADYMHSLALSIRTFRQTLARFTPAIDDHVSERQATAPEAMLSSIAATNQDILLRSRDPRHPLPNRDLDTGFVVKPGGYSLTDSTYADLLHRLVQKRMQAIPPGTKRDIQAYYADSDAPIVTKRKPSKWAQVQNDLAKLATMPTNPEPEPYPTYGDEAERSE
jgi:hypothetical protein